MNIYRTSIGLCALSMLALFSQSIIGCAGDKTYSASAGCGGVLAGSKLSVQYPSRSRDIVNSPLSSARSGQVVISGAAIGGGNITVPFERDATKLEAHLESYSLPNIKTGTYPTTITFYADAHQGGAVVGTATASDVVDCNGQSVKSIVLSAVVKTVTVPSQVVSASGGTKQLTFSALDGAGALVAVSAGSATFSATGTAATVTPDGVLTPVSAGTVQVVATVDGVASSTATITVTNDTLPHYHIYQIDPLPGTGSVSVAGMNALGQVVGNCPISSTNQLAFTWILGVGTVQIPGSLGMGIDDDGNITTENINASGGWISSTFFPGGNVNAGISYTGGIEPTVFFGKGEAATANVYWASPSAEPVTLAAPAGANFYRVAAGNRNGSLVGFASTSSSQLGVYWPTGRSAPVSLQGGGGSPTAISSDGRIVGTAPGGSRGMYYWPDSSSSPTTVTFPDTTLIPFGVNNRGWFVGNAQSGESQYAFVGSASTGPVDLTTLTDTASKGWILYSARAINDGGSIVGEGRAPSGQPCAFVAVPAG